MASHETTAEYQVYVERNVMVAMRDGVRLAANVHRPARDGQAVAGAFPVVLQRTPYNKDGEALALGAAFFTRRGYVTVLQDCRGRYNSEGGFTKYTAEGEDGYDTLEWLGRQDWCNGRVGTYGLSYAAHTQAAAACLRPPNLSCMWLDSGGFANAFQSGVRNGGAFELRQLTWAYKEAIESPPSYDNPRTVRAALEAQSIHDWFERLPWKPGHSPIRWTPDYEDYLLEIWRRENYDDYWKQVGLCAEEFYDAFAGIPQVHMGSWYDPYSRSTTDNFAAIRSASSAPVSLIMGPWTHGARSVSYSGNADFGAAAFLEGNLDRDYNHLRLGFFDRWLKGRRNGWDDEAPVKIFVMGGGTGGMNPQQRLDHGGRWRSEASWPLAEAVETPFYLQPDGGLSIEAPGRNQPPSRYLFDPNHPVPTIGGNISSGQPVMEAGGFDQRETPAFFGSRQPYLPLASRPDVLVFQTRPLEEDMEITGPVSVRLWVSSTAADTDFTAKLVDVYPPSADYPEGYALNLADGILRAKFRDSWEEPTAMEPGRVYPLSLRLPPTSNLFVRGHRIRIDIASNNFPRFDVNGNTGENPAVSPVRLTAVNTVYHDADRPSHALLPVTQAEQPSS